MVDVGVDMVVDVAVDAVVGVRSIDPVNVLVVSGSEALMSVNSVEVGMAEVGASALELEFTGTGSWPSQ